MRITLTFLLMATSPVKADGLWSYITGKDWHVVNYCQERFFEHHVAWTSEEEIHALSSLSARTPQSLVCSCQRKTIYAEKKDKIYKLYPDEGPVYLVDYDNFSRCMQAN